MKNYTWLLLLFIGVKGVGQKIDTIKPHQCCGVLYKDFCPACKRKVKAMKYKSMRSKIKRPKKITTSLRKPTDKELELIKQAHKNQQ